MKSVINLILVIFWIPSAAAEGVTGSSGSLDLDVSPRSSWSDYFGLSNGRITRTEFFARAVWHLPSSVSPSLIFQDHSDHVRIGSSPPTPEYRVLFRPESATRPLDNVKFWRSSSEFFPTGALPLSGLRVAIDPGHIGGSWASAEGRLFVPPCGTPVAEGDMTLHVAKILEHLLVSSGAQVFLTRRNSEPLNGSFPAKFRQRAVENLKKASRPVGELNIQRESMRILLQQAEIESRSLLVNEKIRPDLAVCLHFNAEPWGTKSSPKFSKNNHFHVLIGGNYRVSELESLEQRLNLTRRILEGTHLEEESLAKTLAREVARITRLPPFNYGKSSEIASPVQGTPYVWKRNLMATRLFHCPVVFLEPFVMNNEEFVAAVRLAKSDWMTARPSSDVYEKYAYGVYSGILRHYGKHRSSSAHQRPPHSPHSLHSPQWLDNGRN